MPTWIWTIKRHGKVVRTIEVTFEDLIAFAAVAAFTILLLSALLR